MAFFNELKKNITGVSNSLAKKSEDVIKKSGDVLEIQKAKMRKASLENDLSKMYEKLGKLYFEEYAEGDMPEAIAELCRKITSGKQAVCEAEHEVAQLRGVVLCSNCKAVNEKDAKYCCKCGAEIIHEEVENPEDEEEKATEEVVEEASQEAAEEKTEEVVSEEKATEEAAEEISEEETAAEEAAEEAVEEVKEE